MIRAIARNTEDKAFPERNVWDGVCVPVRSGLPRARERVVAIMKTVFTTGEAAKICKVSQQTIIRCFDSGQLKGFRVPGSRFRRIPRDQQLSDFRSLIRQLLADQ